MRNLTRTIAVVSLLAPASAHPLGIGEIKLHSALNQTLNAEIPLLVEPGDNLSSVKISLAPPDKFDEAGLPWSYFLSKLRFELNGSVIKVTSKDVVKEPVLDFLLEVKWPNGNLYRGFTLLVDPPATYSQATVPLASAPVTEAEDDRFTRRNDDDALPRRRSQAPAEGRLTGNSYGPTRQNDTLWKVAEKARTADASLEQVAVAIYEANPNAFYKPNVNALMAGKTLQIPEKDVILRLSKKQAQDIFNQQVAAWKNGAVNAVTGSPAKSAGEQRELDNKLQLIAPTEASIGENTEVVPGNSKTGEAGARGKAKTGSISSAAANDPMLITMQEKLAALEGQLQVMQKMLALKDEQLALLQNQAKTGEVVKPAEEAPKPTTPAVDPAALATEPAAATPPPVEQPQAPVTEENAGQAKPEAPAEAAKPEQPAVQPPPAKPAPKPVLPAPVPAVIPESDDSLYYWGVGGLGAVLLTGLGLVWWRKRKVEDDINAESIFASSSMIQVPDENELFNVPSLDNAGANYNVGTVGESSFLSEFTPSDFDAFDTNQGEIDPISEADVYLAYGRYQQAEELMRQAIKDQPARDECKLKLFEIFYANENRPAYEAYAKELIDAGKHKDSEFWAKVAEMGAEMCPESALFAASEHAHAAPSQVDTQAYSQVAARDNGLPQAGQTKAMPVKPETEEDEFAAEDNSLDFDLSALDLDKKVDESINHDIDFELSLDDWLNKSEVAESLSQPEHSKTEFESIEFKLDEKPEVKPDEKPILDSKAQEQLDLSDVSLEAFDFESNKALVPDEFVDENEFKLDDGMDDLSLDQNEFDFNFDLDMPDDKDGVGADNLGIGVEDLTDMDELETKLDLARAYMDMGDPEAARDIAAEVLEKGSDEQKKQAKLLLEDIQ